MNDGAKCELYMQKYRKVGYEWGLNSPFRKVAIHEEDSIFFSYMPRESNVRCRENDASIDTKNE